MLHQAGICAAPTSILASWPNRRRYIEDSATSNSIHIVSIACSLFISVSKRFSATSTRSTCQPRPSSDHRILQNQMIRYLSKRQQTVFEIWIFRLRQREPGFRRIQEAMSLLFPDLKADEVMKGTGMLSINHDTFQFREGESVLWKTGRNFFLTIRYQLHGVVDCACIEGSGEVRFFLHLKGWN